MTFLPLEQIDELVNGDPNVAKEALANALTALVHSPEDADRAAETARSLFGGGVPTNVPTIMVSAGMFSVASLLVKGGLCPSTTDARRTIEQGGVSVDGETVSDVRAMIEVGSDGAILKKGKKSFVRVIASE
jgi:tyrosyl-tRNA synthetase